MRRLPVQVGLAVILGAGPAGIQAGSLNTSISSNDLASAVLKSVGNRQAEHVCTVSEPVQDRPPDDPAASSFASPNGTWYANEARTMWAWWWGKRSVGDYKVLWVRPVGAQLKISGRRLDGESPPLAANIPSGYPYTFHATAIAFPSSGCWQVEGTAGDARLTFVVRIP
jgi:hypothetical protein